MPEDMGTATRLVKWAEIAGRIIRECYGKRKGRFQTCGVFIVCFWYYCVCFQ